MSASAAVKAALRGHAPSDEQWRAISHPPEPLAIIAGAGSGKTAVMAARIVWMIEEGLYRPAEILGLTFTNKAAAELEERLHHAFTHIEGLVEFPLVTTYNSFADGLIREFGVRIGIDPDVGLLSKAQSWQLLSGQLGHLPPFEHVSSRSLSSVIRTALDLAEQFSNHLLVPEAVVQEDRRIIEDADQFPDEVVSACRQRVEYARIVQAYREAKLAADRIDYGDQVGKAEEILRLNPYVAEELRRRFPAILLDEYQDTNVAQRKLLQLIALEGHNVTAVGDARQNIYQWRGSTLFNLIDFPTRHFLRAGGAPHDYVPLSTNYRSGAQILEAANRVVEPIPADRRPGEPLAPHSSNGRGAVRLKVLTDQRREAEFIATQVKQLHGTALGPGRDPLDYRDFAVLVRRRAHMPAIYEAFKSLDIPVEVIGLGGLLQVPEVMDTIAWLRVVAEPGPSSNRWLARILMGPRFRIHHRDLAVLAKWAAANTRDLAAEKRAGARRSEVAPDLTLETADLEPESVAFSLLEALDHVAEMQGLGPQAVARLDRARREIGELRQRAAQPLLELVQDLVRTTGVGEALQASARKDADAAQRNLIAFLDVVSGFAPVTGEPSLGTFLSYLDAAEDVEETLELGTAARGDAVTLSTIHQAKGLEFEVVFVPSVSAAQPADGGEHKHSIFPDTRTSDPMRSYSQLPYWVREDADHLPDPWVKDDKGVRRPRNKNDFKDELRERAVEDERRLFYVALTRAKQLLFVTAAWWYERNSSLRGPSQFFDEVASVQGVERLEDDPPPEENPLLEELAELAQWPPEAPSIGPDPLFGVPYPDLIDDLIDGRISAAEVLAKLDPSDRERAERLVEEHVSAIAAIERKAVPAAVPGVDTLSATTLVELLSNRVSTGDLARPLPQRPSEAARLGTEIHRWIEEQSRGLTGLADEEALDAPSVSVPRSRLDEMQKTFRDMGFTQRRLAKLPGGIDMAEVPFVLKLDGKLVRGRIDAVYETEDGGIEIVDFKSGQRIDYPELDQLAVYAAALIKMGVRTDGPITLTYAYLTDGHRDSRTVDPSEVSALLEGVRLP